MGKRIRWGGPGFTERQHAYYADQSQPLVDIAGNETGQFVEVRVEYGDETPVEHLPDLDAVIARGMGVIVEDEPQPEDTPKTK